MNTNNISRIARHHVTRVRRGNVTRVFIAFILFFTVAAGIFHAESPFVLGANVFLQLSSFFPYLGASVFSLLLFFPVMFVAAGAAGS
ncbi:MAG: hypothetical protein LBF09_06760, partial [Odoribacteraceae bacterium]|nr:hypothetical protein [Odoribacteraceae bacterium]